jgi:hypothetical protein
MFESQAESAKLSGLTRSQSIRTAGLCPRLIRILYLGPRAPEPNP